METIRDLLGSVRDYLKDRLANPLYVCYAVAWCVLNFRLLLVLFGNQSPSEKIAHIDTRLYTEWWHWAWFGFGYPLLVAVAFVIASPFVHRWVTLFLKGREKRTIEGFLKIADETPLPKAAADRLRESLIVERRRRIEEGQRATERLDEVEAQLEIAIRQNKELETRLLGQARGDLEGTQAMARDGGDIDVSQSESGDQEEEASDEVYDPTEVISLGEDDFYGVPPGTTLPLVRRGLTREQAEALHHVRNSKEFTAASMSAYFPGKENYAVKVLLDQLSGLKLTALNTNTGNYSLSSAGRQALNAALKRGFRSQASEGFRSAKN